MVIYKVRNKINGKIYIGLTSRDVPRRIRSHRRRGFLIGKAIKKYGIQSFEVSVIDSAQNWESLCEKEIYWIKELKSKAPVGYNMTDGGTSKLSEETKRKISKSLAGRKPSAETIKKLSKSHQKFWDSKAGKELRKKRSKQYSGEGNPMYGSDASKDRGEKISQSLQGNIPWNKGKKTGPLSEKTRKKMSISKKGNSNSAHLQRDSFGRLLPLTNSIQ